MRNSLKLGVSVVTAFFLTIILFGLSYAAEYNISQGLDYSGPYAVVMKPVDYGSMAIFAWWNENVGKKLGIKVNRKPYDTRYDAAVVASLWPGILSRDKPIAHLGVGAPDFVPLMKRLPEDEVIVITSAPSYGFLWISNQWVFQFRPTYMHEMAGLLKWLHENKIKDRPIRIATFSNKKVTFYVDLVESLTEFAKQTPWVDLVGVEWVDVKPVSLITELKKLLKKKPDYLVIQTNTYQALAVIRAEKALGVEIPILLTTHNGIQMCAKAGGDINLLEGHYEAAGIDPAVDMNVQGAQIFENYKKKLGIEGSWNVLSAMGAGMSIMALRAVERAAKKVGSDNITGETVYDALFVEPFSEEEMLGLTPVVHLSKDASFPVEKAKIKITTVKDGKQVLVTEDWVPVPLVPKWGAEKGKE